MPALLGGSIQLFFGSDPASFVAAIQGAQMIKLGITMNTIGYYLMSPPDMGTMADLKGGGSSASGRDVPYLYLSKKLAESGTDTKRDVKFLSLAGGQPSYMAAKSRQSSGSNDYGSK